MMQQAITWMLSDSDTEIFGKYFQTFIQRDLNSGHTTIKTKYRGLLNKLQQFLDDDGCDEETFQAGISPLTSAVGVMNSMKNSNVQQLKQKELH